MRTLLLVVGACASLLAGPARAVTMDWVPVGNPGNAPDTASNCIGADCGQVNYNYYISKYDVTNAQYAEFLNAKAASDPHSLYNSAMASDVNGGIIQSGSSGSYTYAVKSGFANDPVVYVPFWNALRFANWLNNGQGTGDTETGAYTITGAGIAANSITRNPGANIFLPSENEWYKAAYYNPITNSYFTYPAGSSTPTVCAAPGATANTANCNPNPPLPGGVGKVTDVGAYTRSASPYGAFDMGGNVFQWNEQIVSGSTRGIRGGSWDGGANYLATSSPGYDDPTNGPFNVGFRVASLVPEPGTGLLVITGLLGLAAQRRRA